MITIYDVLRNCRAQHISGETVLICEKSEETTVPDTATEVAKLDFAVMPFDTVVIFPEVLESGKSAIVDYYKKYPSRENPAGTVEVPISTGITVQYGQPPSGVTMPAEEIQNAMVVVKARCATSGQTVKVRVTVRGIKKLRTT